MSIRRSLVFVAGVSPSPRSRDNGAEHKAAAVPQMTLSRHSGYITAPPQHTYTHEHRHYENTTVDNITVPASLVRILHPLSAYASVMHPTSFAAERSPDNRSAAMSLYYLGEGLAQFVLLLLWQVGGDDLEVVGPELVDHSVGGGRPAGQSGTARRSPASLAHEPA